MQVGYFRDSGPDGLVWRRAAARRLRKMDALLLYAQKGVRRAVEDSTRVFGRQNPQHVSDCRILFIIVLLLFSIFTLGSMPSGNLLYRLVRSDSCERNNGGSSCEYRLCRG